MGPFKRDSTCHTRAGNERREKTRIVDVRRGGAVEAERPRRFRYEELRLEKEYLLVPLFYLSFYMVSAAVFGLEMTHPSLVEKLSSSASTPWGIGTAIFTHATAYHLLTDMANTMVLSWLVLMLLLPLGRDSVSLAIVLPMVIGLGVNLIDMAIAPEKMLVGSSGVGYGLLGIFAGLAIGELSFSLKGLLRFGWSAYTLPEKNFVGVVGGALITSSLVIEMLFSPPFFFAAVTGAFVIGHIIGFCLGVIAGTAFVVFAKKSEVEQKTKVKYGKVVG